MERGQDVFAFAFKFFISSIFSNFNIFPPLFFNSLNNDFFLVFGFVLFLGKGSGENHLKPQQDITRRENLQNKRKVVHAHLDFQLKRGEGGKTCLHTLLRPPVFIGGSHFDVSIKVGLYHSW